MKLIASVRTATRLRLSPKEQYRIDLFDLTAFLEWFFRGCNPLGGPQCGAEREEYLDITNQSRRRNVKGT